MSQVAVADMLARIREHYEMSVQHTAALEVRLAELRKIQLADPLEICINREMQEATTVPTAASKEAIRRLEGATRHFPDAALEAIGPSMETIGRCARVIYRLKESLDRGGRSLLDDCARFHRTGTAGVDTSAMD